MSEPEHPEPLSAYLRRTHNSASTEDVEYLEARLAAVVAERDKMLDYARELRAERARLLVERDELRRSEKVAEDYRTEAEIVLERLRSEVAGYREALERIFGLWTDPPPASRQDVQFQEAVSIARAALSANRASPEGGSE